MTIFSLNISRFPELMTLHFLQWTRRRGRTELEDMSDKGLEDMGLTRSRRDYDVVKPFWMP